MEDKNLNPQLKAALQPYLDKGYALVSATETSAELVKPKKKMGWWVMLLDTGGYARNRDRTATFKVTETGAIVISGDTLDKLAADETANSGVKIFRTVMLLIFLAIILFCLFIFFGGLFINSS